MVDTDGGGAGTPPWTRLRKILGRVRRRFALDTFDVFGRRVLPADARFEGVPGYRFAWGEPADVERCDAHHTELDARERAEGVARLALGHTAVFGFHGDTAVFTMWVNPRHVNTHRGIKRRLAADQWFIYKAFTSPEHRGKKLYQAGMRFVLAEMARRGMRELIGYAHVEKTVSRKGLSRLDFDSKGRYHVLELPGWRRVIVTRELAASFPEATPRSHVMSCPPAARPPAVHREPDATP